MEGIRTGEAVSASSFFSIEELIGVGAKCDVSKVNGALAGCGGVNQEVAAAAEPSSSPSSSHFSSQQLCTVNGTVNSPPPPSPRWSSELIRQRNPGPTPPPISGGRS